MKKLLVAAAMTAAATVMGAQPAGATVLYMQLTDVTGGVSVTCDNGLGGCAVGFAGAVNGNSLSYTGAVGDWSSGLTAAITNSPGSPLEASLDLTQLVLTNSSLTARDFRILVTARGFTSPSGDPLTFFGSASTSSSGVTGIVSSVSYFDPADTGALVNPINCSFVPGTNNSCAEPTILVANGGGTYSITQVLNVNLGGGQSINLTANSTATAVPEPASMLLLGSGLLGLAGAARRRLKK